MVKLTDEQIQALALCDGEPLSVEFPGSERRYVIVEADVHNAAVEAAEKQRIHESIKRGFEDIKAGLGQPVDVAFADIREKLIQRMADVAKH